MKGVVFNLLESFICENWGDEKYEEIFAQCPLKTKEPFVGPGTYPDSDLMTMAGKTAEMLGLPVFDAVKAFGTYCFPRLAGTFPPLVEDCKTAKQFLLSVDSVIHVEVKKLFPDAVTPKFSYEDLSDDELIIHYSSRRQLCSFMEGLLDGLAEFYSEDITYHQSKCMCDGHQTCDFHLKFSKAV